MFQTFNLDQAFNNFVRNFPNWIYLDSAATTLRPDVVIASFAKTYSQFPVTANSVDNQIAARALNLKRQIRTKIAKIHNCPVEGVVFFSSTTFSLNQIATGLTHLFQPNDEVILSNLEHNANLAPWLALKTTNQLKVKFLRFNLLGQTAAAYCRQLKQLLTSRTKLVSLVLVDNTVSFALPITELVSVIRQFNPQIKIVLDATQLMGKAPLNFASLDVDFLCYSAHKVFGPFGIGIGLGKVAFLNQLTPFLKGSNSVVNLNEKMLEYSQSPRRFEGGSFDLPTLVAFSKALDFLQQFDLATIANHLKTLYRYAIKQLTTLPDIKIYNNFQSTGTSIIFNLTKVNAQDVALYLADEAQIILRSGNHCAFLTDKLFKVKQTLRLSFHFYNDLADIDQLVAALTKLSQKPDLVFKNYHRQLQTVLFANGKKSFFALSKSLNDEQVYTLRNESCSDYFRIQIWYDNARKLHLLFNGEACLIAMSVANLLVKVINQQSRETAINYLKIYLDTFQKTTILPDILNELQLFQKLLYQPHRLDCALFFAQFLLQKL